MKRLIISLITISIFSTSCTSKKEITNKHTFFIINFPELLKTQQKGYISNISDKIEYIRLSTSPDNLLGRIIDAKITPKYIFIHHNGNGLLAQFDRKGSFIRNIGKSGRGPGEYTLIREFSINEEKRLIYIQTNYDKGIMIFSFDGEYLKSMNKLGSSGWTCWAHDTLFIQFSEPIRGNEKFVFIEKDPNGDTVQFVKNYCFWKPGERSFKIYNYLGRNVFYRLNHKLHFKGWYNDTIYTYDKQNKIIPKYLIALKQYKLPDELRTERNLSQNIPYKYYWTGAMESSRYLFIRYGVYSLKLKDKNKNGYMVFDKQMKKGYRLMNGNKGFINDIDGGPNFFPHYTSDSLAFQFIAANELIKHMRSPYFLNTKPKHQKQKEQLKKQMENLSENDNPILMVAKLKEY